MREIVYNKKAVYENDKLIATKLMSTDLQKDLAEAIVVNMKKPRDKRKGKVALVESVGYSPITAKAKPTEIMEQKGVKDALREWGLTEELITTALIEDIKGKPLKRERELSLGAEILGMKIKENSLPPVITNYTQIIINPPQQ